MRPSGRARGTDSATGPTGPTSHKSIHWAARHRMQEGGGGGSVTDSVPFPSRPTKPQFLRETWVLLAHPNPA